MVCDLLTLHNIDLTISAGRFDLVDCMHDLRTAVTIHGDDILAHANWELTPDWLKKYKYVVKTIGVQSADRLYHFQIPRWRKYT